MNHAIVVFGIPIAFAIPMVGVAIDSDAVFLLYMVLAFIVLAGGLGSLIGYHKEANMLKDAEADWVPHKWTYAVAHVLLWAWPVALIYLIQRWRHIGIPWKNLPFVG